MFLEQLIDFLFLAIPWLISEIRCPSRRKQRKQQDNCNDNIIVSNPSNPPSDLVNPEQNFDYKEFPDAGEPENEIEARGLLSAASTSSLNYNSLANTVLEFRSGCFVPHRSDRGPLLSSIARSIPTNVTILLSAIVISGIAGFFAYLDLETTDKCIGIEPYLNNSIPEKVLMWKLIGESCQAWLLNFWFPATIALLFGRKVFLEKFRSLLYIGLIMGQLVVIYKAYLFMYCGSDFRDSYYRYPGNVIFFIGVILGCIEIARATKQSIKRIVLKIGQIFMFSLIMCLSYRNLIVPWFNEQTSDINKAMIAAILPLFALIPVAVGKYVVLCHCTDLIQADVSFVLIYFNYLIPVALYRIMQAELTDLRLFVAFSLLHGTFNIIAQVTRHFREQLWGRALRILETHGFRPVPYCSPRNKRLQADLEIQDMLSQFGTLILSQVYMMLYRFSTFDIALSDEIRRIYPRVVIGLAIEFVFAWLSTFIQVWLYNIGIKTIWFRYWLRHVLANGIIMVVAISYFSQVLLSVFKFRMESSIHDEYTLRNCTMPFTYK